MKKLIASLGLAFTATWASAIPDRLFETGLDLNVGVGNSYFAIDDFFHETLVLDLKKMASSFSEEGLAFSSDLKVKPFLNLNLSPDFRLGLFFQAAGSGYSNIPKAFFDLAANGNELDKTYTGTLRMRGDVTSEFGAKFGTHLFGFDTTFSGSLFLPLFHLEKPKAEYTFRTDSNGKTTATVNTDVPIYSVVPLEGGLKTSDLLSHLFAAGGLDFSVGAEYPLFPDLLIVGGDLSNIPLWGAQMTQRTRLLSSMTFTSDNPASHYDSGNLTETSSTSSFVSDTSPIQVLRPFKINAHAVYMPLGSPLIKVIPNMGIGVYGWVYPEFGVKGQLDLWKWLVVELGSSFEDQLWKQRVALNVNLWILELDLAVAGQSQEIGRSFGSGVSASLGLKLGF